MFKTQDNNFVAISAGICELSESMLHKKNPCDMIISFQEVAMDEKTTGDNNRRHTVIWDDPMIGAQALKTLNGLDYLLGLKDGTIPLPPMYSLFKFRFLEVEAGHIVIEAAPAEYECNPLGVIHGGLACTALDSVTACAVQSVLPAGAVMTTLETKVNFVRAIKLDAGPLRCAGRVIHAGKRVATAEGRITDGSGNLCAHAVSTCLIL